MKLTIFVSVMIFCSISWALEIELEDIRFEQGLSLNSQSTAGIRITHSVNSFTLEDIELENETLQKVSLAGQLLPGEEGYPDLPVISRFIAIPQNASVTFEISGIRQEFFSNISIMPGPRLPLDTEDGPLEYRKNPLVYDKDAFFPESPVVISAPTVVRGIDAVIISISPFQYNPVSQELILNRDLEIEIVFAGGNGIFGEKKYRSVWWEPIIKGTFLNHDTLPPLELNTQTSSRTEDFEYIIITPDDPDFTAWADSIAVFRNEQGIRTGVINTSEIGGNNPNTIETYINNAYNNWDIPPVAVLLLGDYGTTGNTIVSPIWNNYCVSDHIYADVSGNSIADVILARITAQNGAQLATMVGKMLDYERNPIADLDYYNHPITALGWQTERWFQVCSETIGGFWHNELGKDQVRINALYGGNPAVDPWSTAPNTNQVLNYFGPNGLNYIPASPSALGGWTGGTGTMINQAIEAGSFMLVHRDHGSETGWGEPGYNNTLVNMLNNENPIFVFSINCLTGKYNINGECFAEAFHRHPTGALGLIAASEVSYSFVNDAYMWGVMDHMWPEFMPDLGTNASDCDFILPAFANAAGKLFLMGSNWPYNEQSKPVTYNLFHQHGGAFMNVYSELPQNLNVFHENVLLSGLSDFEVFADAGSFIGLSVNGEVVGTAIGNGGAIDIAIPAQQPNNIMKVTVTKQNHYRYAADVMIISPDQYVIFDEVECIEISGHIDGSIQSLDTVQLNIGLQNIGLQPTGLEVSAMLSSDSDFVNILDNTAIYGQIPPSGVLFLEDAFLVEFLGPAEDNTIVTFLLQIESDGNVWYDDFEIELSAPHLQYDSYSLDIFSGDDDILDPGEVADVFLQFSNLGSGFGYNIAVVMFSADPYINISGSGMINMISSGESLNTNQPIQLNVAADCPVEYFAEINVLAQDETGLVWQTSFALPIGFYLYDFENGDSGWQHYALGDDWQDEWHLSSYRNHTAEGSFSQKCGGAEEQVYANYLYAAMEMPAIDLNAGATVKFYHWLEAGANAAGNAWDGGIIEISVNNEDWMQITPVGGYSHTILNIPNSPFPAGIQVFSGNINWEEVVLDLSPYSGSAHIRFVFGSTGLVTGEGWYIDDVSLMYFTDSQDVTIQAGKPVLEKNFPNPFNPDTNIRFSSSDPSQTVRLDIFNLKGQKIRTLVDEKLPAGNHAVTWNGEDFQKKPVSSGVYIYRLKIGDFMQARKMILLK